MLTPDMPAHIPSVSVIIPAYNQALYIAQAIQSVLEQTYPHFELIVVDDGSTDETPGILAVLHDPRIHIVRQPNAGLSAARNRGLRESSAPLVTFLDSDDYFLADKLEVMVRFLQDHPDVGLVAGEVKYINNSGKTIREPVEVPTKLALPELLCENPICVSGILLRRMWLERVGVFDESLRACEDWDLWLRLLAAGCVMAWVDHPVVAYRIHSNQMTRQSDRMRKAILTVLEKFFAQPDLPQRLHAYNRIARASGLVHASAYAYLANEFDKGQRDLAEAIQIDHTLKDQQYKRLVQLLVGWSEDPRLTNPADFLQRIINNPPPRLAGLGVQLRRSMADVILAPLFRGSRECWRNHRHDLLRVILYKPDWLLNRGVLRMIADAWLSI